MKFNIPSFTWSFRTYLVISLYILLKKILNTKKVVMNMYKEKGFLSVRSANKTANLIALRLLMSSTASHFGVLQIWKDLLGEVGNEVESIYIIFNLSIYIYTYISTNMIKLLYSQTYTLCIP